jgi:nitronate monooxygenase
MALVPEVVEAVSCPVAAAGGIVDGRGLAAALTLGAAGVLMGSRFVATQEAIAPEIHKKAVLEHTGFDTGVTAAWSGWPARAVVNEYVRRYEVTGAPTLPFPTQYVASSDIGAAATERNDPDHVPLWAGQGIGRIQDLPWAAEVVERMVAEARRVLLEEVPARVTF